MARVGVPSPDIPFFDCVLVFNFVQLFFCFFFCFFFFGFCSGWSWKWPVIRRADGISLEATKTNLINVSARKLRRDNVAVKR